MKIENKVIGISILLGLLTGAADSVIDYLMFYEKPFWDLLIFDVPKLEIFMRSIILIVFTISGFIVSKIIVKHRKAEQKQNAFLNLVIDSLEHPFCVIDAVDYKIKIANFAIGLEQQAGNSTCHAIMHNNDTPCNSVEHPCPIEMIKKTKKSATLEHTHYDKDGSSKTFEVHAHPILDSNGNVSQVIEYCIDITERKKDEEFLRETEEKYRTLFESSRDAIMTLAPPAWFFTSGNPATMQLFGVSDEAEFISIGPWQLSPERQPDGKLSDEKAIEMIETAMLNGSHFFEWTHCHSDGTPFPAEVLLTRMKQRGKVLLQATVRDITDRRRAEEKMRENEAHLRTLVRTIPDLVWLKDQQGIYLACNPRFEGFFGAKEKDIIGKTDYDFVDKKLADFFRKNDKIAMAKGKPSRNEEEVIFADDGHREILETIKTPMYTIDKQIVGVLGIGRDITERKRIEEEREKLIRKLQNALAEVKTLSGLLPICTHCKNVRDDKGYWNKIESYLHQHSEAQFSHGICPECAKKFFPDFDLYNDSE